MTHYKIYDTQNGRYFADDAVFDSKSKVRDQLISYHLIDAEEPELLKKFSLNDILEWGQWELEKID